VPQPQTSKPEYAPHLLASLRNLGGEASRDAVLERTYTRMEGRLHPADHALLHPGAVPRGRNEAEHMLDGLVEDGYLEEDGATLRLTRRGRDYVERLAEAL
jgi:hypothetical protein